MNTRILFYITFVLLCLVFFTGLWAGTAYFQDLPERIRQSQSLHGVKGGGSLGSEFPLIVFGSDMSDGSPNIQLIE